MEESAGGGLWSEGNGLPRATRSSTRDSSCTRVLVAKKRISTRIGDATSVLNESTLQ